MKKTIAFFCMLLLGMAAVHAQNKEVTGVVTDSSGAPLPGATINIKGVRRGTSAGTDGSFRISIPEGSGIIVSAVGFETREISITGTATVSVALQRGTSALNEVVVTALGVRRNRNQVPYAAQQISGDEVSKTRTTNFVNNLSGKVSGLEIRQTNTLGGSTNVVLRGVKSITGSNQALFVIDGVPFDNSNTNTNGGVDPLVSQVTGRGGYDYGNAAADINPDDIESMTVLKGAAASALYGSRGSNGVILITTKKGSRGLGITVNSGVTMGIIDKSTFAKYQKEYGAGYNPVTLYEDPSQLFLYRDINGDGVKDLVTPLYEDASYGARFDANKMVYQWDAFDPASPNFGKARPWMAAPNDPLSFFEKPVSSNQNVMIDGASDKGSFKLGYTRNDDKGILPNSKITKNLINFSSTYNIASKLTAAASINYSGIDGRGRYGTGYDDKNIAQNFRQWWQTNVDVKEQKDAYFRNRQNVTWNWADPTNLVPIYWDNPYFSRYENYENDSRNRFFGNTSLSYKITDWLNVLGRVSLDSYDEIQEERQALGSVSTSNYSRFNRVYRETNYDFLANFDKNFGTDFNIKALAGINIRKQHIQTLSATTNGGLIVEKIYSLSNSANPPNAPYEQDLRKEIDGIFAGGTVSWRNMVTLDGTIRKDASSTLPKGNNTYYYPSASLGFVFSQLLPGQTWLSYGKLRGNYAQVGADAPFYSTINSYVIVAPFGSNPQASVGGTRNNPDLKPEQTKSTELGLEMAFLKSRLGFDVTYYTSRTFNQILPTTVSTTTGYNAKYLNAGTIENTGVEVSLYGTPVKTRDLSWTVNVNWTRNRNKVLELFQGSSNLLLANFQGGVSINATLNQPFGTLRGSNFVYTNGQKTVAANGRYVRTTTANEVIGNPNPDWIGGINNTIRYKNLALSFLIDVRQGGDVFSLDMYYGLATGLYPETAGLNDLGNPSRNTIANGGGLINAGVTADGKPNTTRVNNGYGIYGYFRNPAAAFVYDASYVKLREMVLTYSLPKSIFGKLNAFKGVDLSLIGRNLWLIHKNLPYADPEETIGSGNYQGYQVGAYPTTRNFTFNVRLRF